MALDPGTKLGAFEITGLLGKGGMGEVYRARDTKLGRDVALKVLSEAFASDKEMLARFEREALSLAKLDHPNIAAIYEVGQSVLEPETRPLTPEEILYGIRTGPAAAGAVAGAGVVHFLVMQLVDGETLSDRLHRGPLSIEEATRIFSQIAEGLEAAHERGIVHRDLKPANIKVDPHDRVKILDFGIAKSTEGHPAPGAPTPTPSSRVDPTAPTRPLSTPTGPLTGEEMLIGTPQYMSPEQIRGKHVDRRSDIWAFGVCLYQALTGHLPFDGEVVADVFSAVLRDDLDLDRLPAGTPLNIRILIERCLERDPKLRLRDIGEGWVLLNHPRRFEPPQASPHFSAPLALFRVELPPETRLSTGLSPLTISRAGDCIAVALVTEDVRHLYVRRMDSIEFRLIPGTERARMPSFSPKGDAVAFIQGRAIKYVPVDGGTVRTLTHCESTPLSLYWTHNDEIVWNELDTGLFKAPVGGGERQTLSAPEKAAGEQWHSPSGGTLDGRWILGVVTRRDGSELVYFSTQSAGKRVDAGPGEVGRFIGNDYMIVSRGEELFAAPIAGDPPRWSAEPVRVLEGVRTDDEQRTVAAFDVSDSGTLAYAPAGSGLVPNAIYWVSMSGERREITKARRYQGPRISPDGSLLSIGCVDPHGVVLMHIYDLERGVLEKMTPSSSMEAVPLWHPDGSRIVISIMVGSHFQLHEFSLYDRKLKPIGESGITEVPADISSDGRYLAYSRWNTPAHFEIRVRDESGNVEVVVDSPARNVCARFDPQVTAIAYASNETGSWEVFIVPFKTPGRRIQVSVDGGADPIWAPDGSALYYRRGDTVMAVDVSRDGRMRVGQPRRLFDFPFGARVSIWAASFDIHPDGTKFIMADQVAGRVGATEIMVTVNWKHELDQMFLDGNG